MNYGKRSSTAKEPEKMSEGLKPLPEDVRLFIHDVTLFIQSHRSKTEEQMDDMFQKAYVLYSKYDVENVSVESRPEPRQDWNEEAINKIFHEHSTLGFYRFVKKYGTSNIAKSLIQHFKPAAIAGLEKIAFSLANDIQGLYNLEIGVVSDIEAIILKELSKLTPPAKNDILMPSHLHGARKEDDCTIASPAKVVWPEKMEYVGGARKVKLVFTTTPSTNLNA